jgi:PAT family beta-lactamase induction signal transducer AmpG
LYTPRWLSSLKVYADPRMLILLALGFASGLPRLLVYSTLTFWLLDVGLDIQSIGLFAATGSAYTLKFIWAPLVDRLPLPGLTRWLGRRRSWLVLTQLGLVGSLTWLAGTQPGVDPVQTALAAFAVSICSATQDIVIDAWRVESLLPEEQGAGAASAVFGYRLGMLAASAGVLYMVTFLEDWALAYGLMAALMVLGLVATLLGREPERASPPGPALGLVQDVVDGVVGPLRDFVTRRGWLLVLTFVILYKLGDALAGAMTNPLLVDVGFSKIEIANVAKTYGLVATIGGVLLGGWLTRALGVTRALWIAGFLQMASNLMFAVQAFAGDHLGVLIATIGVENLTGGVGTAAFVAYLSALCNRNYSATQYALLTALAGLLRTLLSTASGVLAAAFGWIGYFGFTTLAALPGLVVLAVLMRLKLDGGPGELPPAAGGTQKPLR